MWLDPPKLPRSRSINLVFDGNSLFYGLGAGGPSGQTVANQIAPKLPLFFNGATSVTNFARSGQTWGDMSGRRNDTGAGDGSSDIDGAYVSTPGWVNILALWETTNSIYVGRSAADAADDARLYVLDRLAAHPGWRIIVIGSIPRQSVGGGRPVDTDNLAMLQCDATIRGGLRGWGGRMYLDPRCAGSPFRLRDYTAPAFAENDAIWYESAGGRVHCSAAGYGIITGLLMRGILNLAAR